MSNPTDARMKERRKKIIAALGGAVLVVLFVIQAPKLMDAFGGSAEAAPPATDVSPTETAAHRSPAPAAGSLAAVLAAERRVVREPGRLYGFSRFAYRDPFTTASRPVAKSRRPSRRAPIRRLRYTVIVHTLPVSMARGRAQSLARRVSRRLGRRAGVLKSSSERTLRAGYWVVHVGSYRTRAGAAGTLRAALRLNRRAYIRPIIR